MKLEKWNALKAGEVVMYTGAGNKKGIFCVLTGDDENHLPGPIYKGMCLLGTDKVWNEKAPWCRLFKSNNYIHWKKVDCIILSKEES